MAGVIKVSVFFTLIALLTLCVSAQDLGSSNDLFGGKKTKPKTTTATPQPTLKRKTATPKAKIYKTPIVKPKENITASKFSKKPPRIPKGKPNSARKTEPETIAALPAKPIADVAKPPIPPVSNPAVDELFEQLIVDGNIARDDRNYPAAETAYQRAKNLKPKNARAVYGLGNLYTDQQRWEEAEHAYRSALQIDPSSAIINVALSYVLSQPIMVPNLSDRYDEAERLARHAIELAPSNALAFDQLGVAMELGGNISEETENAFRNAIRLDSSFTPAYAHLGRLLNRQGRAKESAAAYENAVKRSGEVPTLILVAEVMHSDQRYAESEPLLRKAVDDDPKNPVGLMLLGKALTTLGNYDEAEKFLQRSLAVSGNGFMPNALLANLYLRQGKVELAENALMQALRFVSANEKRNLSTRFEAVGDGYSKAGNATAAERVYKQAAALDPERESLAAKLPKSKK